MFDITNYHVYVHSSGFIIIFPNFEKQVHQLFWVSFCYRMTASLYAQLCDA